MELIFLIVGAAAAILGQIISQVTGVVRDRKKWIRVTNIKTQQQVLLCLGPFLVKEPIRTQIIQQSGFSSLKESVAEAFKALEDYVISDT